MIAYLTLILFLVLAMQIGCDDGTPAIVPPITEVDFVSEKDAWIVTANGNLKHLTSDGTTTSFENFGDKPFSIGFLSEDSGYFADRGRNIWHYDGRQWKLIGKHIDRSTLVSLHAANESVSWLRSLQTLSITKDGGRSWTSVLSTDAGVYNQAFSFADGKQIFLYGHGGDVTYSNDEARTWRNFKVPVKMDVEAFDCRQSKPFRCLAGSFGGELFQIDESLNVRRLAFPVSSQSENKLLPNGIYSIKFVDGTRIIAAGYLRDDRLKNGARGALWLSTDDGKTWRSINVPNDDRFLNATMFGNVIWLASESKIYRSSDSGENWTMLLTEEQK